MFVMENLGKGELEKVLRTAAQSWIILIPAVLTGLLPVLSRTRIFESVGGRYLWQSRWQCPQPVRCCWIRER